MKSEPLSVLSLFKPVRQFRVPFFQRTYKWNQDEQWAPLLEDIQAKALARLTGPRSTPHFLGAVVIQQHESDSMNSIQAFDVIDGQQRLTTLQYVLAALRIAHRELSVDVPANLEACLANASEELSAGAAERYKVWPTFTDRAHHLRTMTALSLDDLRAAYPPQFTGRGSLRVHDAARPPSLGAVWFFTTAFMEWMGQEGQDPTTAGLALVDAILSDLQVVSLRLEAHDDPQVIFETLNGRGARLSAIDLIRNLIFMRADEDESADPKALYETHWLTFEAKDWTQMERRGRLLKPRLEWMVRTLLETITQGEVEHQRLYNEYKAFATAGLEARTAEEQLKLLNAFGAQYTALVTGTGSSPIARFGRRVNAYEATTVYPLALMIATSDINDLEQEAMFGDLLSYLVRRAACGLTTKNYNLHFLAGLKHLGREGVSARALRDFLATAKGDATRWPRDGEFLRVMQTVPLYYGNLDAPKTRQLLTEIEGELRRGRRTEEPEVPNLSHLDIDHIMPRNWWSHWPLDDGTVATSLDVQNALNAERAGLPLNNAQQLIVERERLVHTLGNLTLLNLSVNRSAQDKDFAHKRDMLISATNLSLNVQLIQLQAWNSERIKARATELSGAALRLYPGLKEDEPISKPVPSAVAALTHA